MNLDEKQLKSKPKKIGLLKNGKPVIQVETKGGFFMCVSPKDTGFETIGTGSHPAIARHIAEKLKGDITWTELNKSDHVPRDAFEALLPKYEQITSQYRKANGDK